MVEAGAGPGSRRLSGDARRARVLEMVLDAGFLTTAELSEFFGVSEMTIRRDTAQLVASGQLRNVHGGVAALPGSPVGRGRDYSIREKSSWTAKRAIAAAIVNRLQGSTQVAFDAGTTIAAAAELFRPEQPVTVVTHSLAAMNALAGLDTVQVQGLGGRLHSKSMSFSGPQTVQSIRNLRVELFLLAASGLDARGVYCGNDYDAETKRALIEASDRVILVTDSSKFAIPAMVRTCPLDVIAEAIIDDGATDKQCAMLRDAGIDVTVVHPTTVQ